MGMPMNTEESEQSKDGQQQDKASLIRKALEKESDRLFRAMKYGYNVDNECKQDYFNVIP